MGGLVHKVSPGAPQWDSSPEDQGWTLTMAGGNRGGQGEARPQVSWAGLRRATGLVQALKVPGFRRQE